MKYMVMECHPAYAVVLDSNGRFLKVANLRYEVGQSVTSVMELNLPQIQERSAKRNNRKWMVSLTTMAACLVLMVTSVFYTNQMPFASVYMTINPEVRIDVNRKDAVVGVDGINADGAELLEGYDYKKKDLDLVMDELVDRAIDMGYLHEGGKITLTLDADDEWVVSHEEHLTSHLNEYLTEKISVSIDVTRPATQEPTQETNQTPSTSQTVVIPVGPESDYGEDDYEEPAAESPYGTEDDGQSNYDNLPDDDDGQTDYGTEPVRNGDSSYVGPEDDGQSAYTEQVEDGQSTYAVPEDDGQSEYVPDDDDSGESQSNYGSSGYNSDDDSDDDD